MNPRDRNDLHSLVDAVRIVPPEREPEPRPEPTPTVEQEPFWQQLVKAHAAWSIDHGERPGVYWHGAVGCGKTFLAELFLRACRRRGWRTFAGHVPDLVTETQAAMAREDGCRSTHAMLGAIREAQIVLLDDLGRERDGYGQDVARQLVNACRDRFLIVTANRPVTGKDGIATAHNDEGLASRLLALEQVEWPASMPDRRAR